MTKQLKHAIEETAKVGYAIGKFSISYFYNSSNLAILKKASMFL